MGLPAFLILLQSYALKDDTFVSVINSLVMSRVNFIIMATIALHLNLQLWMQNLTHLITRYNLRLVLMGIFFRRE